MDRISLNFIYTFILTRSMLKLLHIIFRTFVPELWPLIYSNKSVSTQYLESKWTDFDQTLFNYYTDKIYVGIFSCHFSQICKKWPLIDVRITLPLNILKHSGLLLHARHCRGAIVRFSDNSCWYKNRAHTGLKST